MYKKSIQLLFALSVMAAGAQATSISYFIQLGNSAFAFTTPLNGDSGTLNGANDGNHFGGNPAQLLGTTDVFTYTALNLTPNAPSNGGPQSKTFTQSIAISAIGGPTLTGPSSQTLSYTIQDAVTGGSHVFTFINPLPSVQFSFTDGSTLTFALVSPPTVTLATSATATNNTNLSYGVTYAAAAPEPATLGLSAAGLLALAFAARRKLIS
jgi:hypothetical protein